jgi:hypothetical protein
MCCISVVTFLYFRIFWAFFFITFLSPQIATSISIHVLFIITDYDVQFIVEDGPAGLHVLIPWYSSS